MCTPARATTRRRARALPCVLGAVLVSCTLLGADRAAPRTIQQGVIEPNTAASDWPEVHRDAQLSGYAPEATITDADASKLGLGWAVNLYAPALSSPVVAY